MKRLLLCVLFVSCRPDFGERDSLITRTTVLAVRADPPEARPGEVATYSLLVATPDGGIATPLASWAYCASARLLTENGSAGAACLDGRVVRAFVSDHAAIPSDACALFGPEIASADLRPHDADITGGFYQPVRVTVFDATGQTVALGLERVRCNLANANADVVRDYGRRYHANQNPVLQPIDSSSTPRGGRVTLRATWEPPETYVVYENGELVDHRESMRVSWYATAGAFANDRTGRSEEELETFTTNDWTAPDDARVTHFFVVLRDARGGVAFTTFDVTTR